MQGTPRARDAEEEDESEKVLEGVEEKKKALFDLPVPQIEADAGEVAEANAKRPRAPLAVTKETILAAIDRGDKD